MASLSNHVTSRPIQSFTRIIILIVACFAVFSGTLNADEPTFNALQKAVDAIQSRFDTLHHKAVKVSDLDAIAQQFTTLDDKIESCISINTDQLESTKKSLGLLGSKQTSEDQDIQVKRIELTHKSQIIDNQLKRCSVLKIQIDQLKQNIQHYRQTLLKRQFFSREFSLLTAISRLLDLNDNSIAAELDVIQPIAEKLFNVTKWTLLLLGIAGLGIGFLWQRIILKKPASASQTSSPTLLAAVHGLQRTAPAIMALLLIWLYLNFQDATQQLTSRVIVYGLILITLYGLLRGILFPHPHAIPPGKLPPGMLRLFSWLFIVFTLIAFFFNQEASGRYSDSSILYLGWFASLAIAALNLILLLWIVARHLSYERKSLPSIYLLPIVTMVGVLAAAGIGYRNIASLFFFGTINSLIVITFAFVLLRVSSEFFDSLDEGKTGWQYTLRNVMGIEKEHAFPGVLWLRILLFFSVALTSIVLLMYIWGSSHQRITSLLEGLKNGITIGSVTLDLLNLMYAMLILVGVLSILPFIKNQLVAGWLKHSNLSRGAREATQTLVGYSGVAIAILWALYVAGVNFQNLAIVAGALSVGIGFGLQNIVNNFVSGLILLFERPIRRGDWVVVGETEGYVKDISIRSTTIQTFERADVIVPNSELISNQVTNWVLSNTIGRLKVPIGVAYGSDVSQVIEILEEIADSHPDVISNLPDYPIRVLLRQFGDNSLDFELRCYVRNIDNRLLILSDLNQGIDREFRNANIEIPFPQRVVYVHNNAKQE